MDRTLAIQGFPVRHSKSFSPAFSRSVPQNGGPVRGYPRPFLARGAPLSEIRSADRTDPPERYRPRLRLADPDWLRPSPGRLPGSMRPANPVEFAFLDYPQECNLRLRG